MPLLPIAVWRGWSRACESMATHFTLCFYKPSAGFDAGTAGIMIVLLGVVKLAMHAGIQANDHAFQFARLDTYFFAGSLKMLRADQSPALDLDGKANGIAGVGINRHFMGVAGSFAVEFSFHNVTGSVTMRAGVHSAGDLLRQNAAFGHGVRIIDYRLVKIRPAGNFRAEGMRQVNKYFFTHYRYLLEVIIKVFYQVVTPPSI